MICWGCVQAALTEVDDHDLADLADVVEQEIETRVRITYAMNEGRTRSVMGTRRDNHRPGRSCAAPSPMVVNGERSTAPRLSCEDPGGVPPTTMTIKTGTEVSRSPADTCGGTDDPLRSGSRDPLTHGHNRGVRAVIHSPGSTTHGDNPRGVDHAHTLGILSRIVHYGPCTRSVTTSER